MNRKEIYQGSSFLINFKYLKPYYIASIVLLLNIFLFMCTPSSTFEKIEVNIGEEIFIIEVVRKQKDQEYGLMYRENLGEKEGMLFAYDYDKHLNFWNNNVNFPLSIAFMTKTGKIVQIESMKAGDPSSVYSKLSVRYALEVNQGVFDELGIGVNDYIILPEEFK